jgi:hypothetical protein
VGNRRRVSRHLAPSSIPAPERAKEQRSCLEVGCDGDHKAASRQFIVFYSIQHFRILSKRPGSACASSREALLAGMMPAERRLGPRLWKRNPGVEGAECQTAQCLTQFFSARPAKTRPARPDSTTESIRHDAPPPDLSFRFSGSMSRGAVRRCGRWLRSVRLLVLDRWRFTDQDTTSRLSRCRDVTSQIAIVGSAESWGASGPTGV